MSRQLVSDLTIDELRNLVQSIIRDSLADVTAEVVSPQLNQLRLQLEDKIDNAVFQLEQQLPDPDEGLELNPQFERELMNAQRGPHQYYSHKEVKKKLKLDD